ncbi:MAG: M6 family metalloprotease domain-containing protein [Paludibacter sp.]|nr:M6 family metalloprotease domain-containing protein [Bacteroidales bacterium]MCM1069789.1 M6 family metalloprotease domain-containing protein [Prevotella sp.]MCM1354511.1 M6 family metalloprotease domain-containing protein [Bacteroides sp.]MCM1443314.1 M6 family metalloprotease domain-containing protein [Muribaculum sp.]MCM1482438.1 M6 family metalloprotease domain-containing protein [Paludibacter sp.]
MKRLNLLLFIGAMCCCRLWAVQATSEPLWVTQPDGTQIEVYLHGNEFYHYYATKDGTIVERNEQGFYQTAIARKAVKAAKMPQAVQASFPLQGKVRSVAILVNFTDVPFVTPNANQAFSDLLNKTGYDVNGGTGSARDYFLASSNGQFDPQFDVYGPYTLAHEQAYYGANSGNSSGVHARDMIIEACLLAEQDGVDFTLYDEDNNGILDNVFVYYAGYNEAEHGGENTVWPHRSAIYNGPTVSGVQVFDYACTSELKGYTGTVMCGIGTFCHEFGHVLGLPDLYDTENSGAYTVGSWDIMSSGNYNNEGRTPPTYSAFERFMLGWLKPEQLNQPNNYVLQPIATDNTAYLIAEGTHNLSAVSPNYNEYFLIENRQKVGWDAAKDAIPGTGLLITHITYNSTSYNNNTFNNNRPLGYDIVEAYSRNPSSSSASDTYPGTAGVTAFLPTLNSGTVLNEQLLSKIVEMTDNSVLFHYGLETGTGFSFVPETLEEMVSTYDTRVVEYGIRDFDINGSELTADSVILTLSSSFFELGIDGTWLGAGKSFQDAVEADGSYHRHVQIRHTPRIQNCTAISGTFRIATTDGMMLNQLALAGVAPRPTYITTVNTLQPDNITPYSFTASWDVQSDAEYYYLTLYRLYDEISDVMQSFEHFDNWANIQAENWTANFVNVIASEVSDGKYALGFRTTGNSITSELYPNPVTKVSFWLSNTYIPVDGQTTGGQFLLEACDSEGQWSVVDDNIVVLRTTRNVVKNYEFSEADDYVQFRLTYQHNGGNGMAVVDAFTARMTKRVEYIYRGTDYAIPNDRAFDVQTLTINGLQSGTTYYYQMQAEENKGCEEHITPLGAVVEVTIPWGVDDERQFTVTRTGDNGLVAFLPTTPDAEKKIFIYTPDGRLICSVDIPRDASSITLPAERLQPGTLYLAKYCYSDKMKRKDLWAKFIY